jgi:Mg2+ and Co2+ transporter CorA
VLSWEFIAEMLAFRVKATEGVSTGHFQVLYPLKVASTSNVWLDCENVMSEAFKELRSEAYSEKNIVPLYMKTIFTVSVRIHLKY